MTGTWAQARTEKGLQPDEGRQSQAHARNSLGRPAWEVRVGERWRPADRNDVQVDGRSVPRQEGGGGKK